MVYAVPLACLVAALLALVWAQGGDASRDATGGGLDAKATSAARDVLEAPARKSSADRFLKDLASVVDAGSGAGADGAEIPAVTWRSEADVPQAGDELLEAYRDEGEVSIVASGYLDLKGNAWGAVFRGPGGWVDIATVMAVDGASEIRAVRLVPDDAAKRGGGDA